MNIDDTIYDNAIYLAISIVGGVKNIRTQNLLHYSDSDTFIRMSQEKDPFFEEDHSEFTIEHYIMDFNTKLHRYWSSLNGFNGTTFYEALRDPSLVRNRAFWFIFDVRNRFGFLSSSNGMTCNKIMEQVEDILVMLELFGNLPREMKFPTKIFPRMFLHTATFQLTELETEAGERIHAFLEYLCKII